MFFQDLGVTETDLNSADSSTLSSSLSRLNGSDRSRLQNEIAELQRHLAESRENEQAARERLAADDQVEMNILQDLRDVVDNLEATNGRVYTLSFSPTSVDLPYVSWKPRMIVSEEKFPPYRLRLKKSKLKLRH
jgi:hypothetical protein